MVRIMKSPSATQFGHARVQVVFRRQSGGEYFRKENTNSCHALLDKKCQLTYETFNVLGGVPAGIDSANFGSGALQLLQALHLQEVVVRAGEVAYQRLPRARRGVQHLVRHTNAARMLSTANVTKSGMS